MPDFTDQFSKQAERYSRFRPGYPDKLYDFLIELVENRQIAWDCATGNGQAAVKLAEHFDKVLATDASTRQIELAKPHEKIEYRVATAEESGFPEASIDLISVANAIHWFDLPGFFKEAKRVLKPGGIVAAWCYENFEIEESVKHAFVSLYDEIKDYWAPQLDHVRSHYKTIDMPFHSIEPPDLEMKSEWDLAQCLGYLSSWSAVQNYINEKNESPIELNYQKIESVWGTPSIRRSVAWKLHMKIGRAS
ncbi:MAG: class I SAM-dependent methyltransferase [Candidatus Obscuribacterales bacterium]|nr:class I SAM-dependent methyltransferase [Candidatus Obscuribacterales bacterium]